MRLTACAVVTASAGILAAGCGPAPASGFTPVANGNWRSCNGAMMLVVRNATGGQIEIYERSRGGTEILLGPAQSGTTEFRVQPSAMYSGFFAKVPGQGTVSESSRGAVQFQRRCREQG